MYTNALLGATMGFRRTFVGLKQEQFEALAGDDDVSDEPSWG